MVKTKNIYLETKLKNNFLLIKTIKPVKLSGSTIYLTDTVKIFLFWIVSKLVFPYRSKSVKETSFRLSSEKIETCSRQVYFTVIQIYEKNIYNTVIELQKTIKKS